MFCYEFVCCDDVMYIVDVVPWYGHGGHDGWDNNSNDKWSLISNSSQISQTKPNINLDKLVNKLVNTYAYTHVLYISYTYYIYILYSIIIKITKLSHNVTMTALKK